MFHDLHCTIRGVAPLLMHNGQLADPLNSFAQAMKKISGNRDKTEAELEELARLEWFGSLYLHQQEPCLPGELIEGALVGAAKKRRRGKQVAAGVWCQDNFPLQYEGPRALEELWEDPRFRFTTGVRVKQNRVMRTRPRFEEWATDITVIFNDELVNQSEVLELLRIAGEQVGLGDWRPKFGRFDVETAS
jgi:hypothetical protein